MIEAPRRFLALSAFALAVGAAASCTTGDSSSASTQGAGGAQGDCVACIQDSSCDHGGICAQFGGDAYCAADCTQGGQAACASGHVCTMVMSAEGHQVPVCLPQNAVCSMSVGQGGTAATTGSGGASSSSSSSSSSSTGSGGMSPIGENGGTIDTLSFAIVGDTRPASEDDTAAYPTAVITKIWQDVEAANPRPAFALSTGDYQFSNPYGSEAPKQLKLYLQARSAFTNIVFPALGNHECTGGTASNCGKGNKDGITNNYTAFLSQLLGPLNKKLPYYEIDVNGANDAWTSKFLFVAANAWDSAQSTWLDTAMAKATTYTFVVRHEGSIATTAPGVTPSANIMAKHPYTLLIAGHTHTYEYFSKEKQVIVGNGGAPLSGKVNYGYVIARQRMDGAIEFKEYDYSTNAVGQTFAVKADGSPAP